MQSRKNEPPWIAVPTLASLTVPPARDRQLVDPVSWWGRFNLHPLTVLSKRSMHKSYEPAADMLNVGQPALLPKVPQNADTTIWSVTWSGGM